MKRLLYALATLANNFAISRLAAFLGIGASIYSIIAVFGSDATAAGWAQIATLGCFIFVGLHCNTHLNRWDRGGIEIPILLALGLFVCNLKVGTNARFPGLHLGWLWLAAAVSLSLLWLDLYFEFESEYDERGEPQELMKDWPLMRRFRRAIGALTVYFVATYLALYQPWHGDTLDGLLIFGSVLEIAYMALCVYSRGSEKKSEVAALGLTD